MSCDDAGLFSIPNFGDSSTWLDQINQEAETSLLSLDIEKLSKPSTNMAPASHICLDLDGFFKLPSLISDATLASKPNDGSDPAETSCETDNNDETHDSSNIWLMNDIQTKAGSQCKTWQDFAAGSQKVYEPTLLSELTLPGLEALTALQASALNLNNTETITVMPDQLLASLFELALGRESVFFKRCPYVSRLEPALSGIRIRGYSEHVFKAVYTTCSTSSQLIDKIRGFMDDTYRTMASKSRIAVASALRDVLQALYRYVIRIHIQPRSVLQLQATVADIMAVTYPCCQLLERINPDMTDVAVISSVFQFASLSDESDFFRNRFSHEVLQQVMAPWFAFASEWLGIRPENGVPLSKTKINATKGFVSVALESYVDDFGRDLETVDFRLQEDKVPHFLPDRLASSIFETGCSLRFIRTFHPGHPLSSQKTIDASDPPELRFLYTWEEVIKLEGRVLKYRDRLWSLVQQATQQHTEVSQDNSSSEGPFQFTFFGKDQRAMEESMAASIMQMNADSEISRYASTIDDAVQQQFDGPRDTNKSYLAPHWSLVPTLALSCIASAQAQIVGRESLRLLLDEHDLQHHLDIQKQFQLFGNGIFCSRLTQALFNPSFDSAESSGGNALSSGTLGLRLGGRATWPPASSELRLALVGILAESYSHNGHGSRSPEAVLPGDLSFAVRNLSLEEIDKCMDQDSIHALDFLRLSYQTPPALSSIITPMALVQYDRIFKLLLRVMRMLHVVDQICRESTIQHGSYMSSDTEARFVREAKHFVSNFAAYVFDTAIAVPWRKFIHIQQEVHEQLHSPLRSDTSLHHTLNPEYIRDCHDQALHEIAVNIFIRKKQRPVLALVEEIFGFVLQFAKTKRTSSNAQCLSDDSSYDFEKLYYDFKQHVQVFITVCRRLSEKTGMDICADSVPARYAAEGPDSLIDQLLSRLDLDHFYVK